MSLLNLLTGAGGVPAPPGPAPVVFDTLRQIAGQVMRTGRVTTGRTAPSTYVSNHIIYANATGLKLVYGGNLPAGVTMPARVAVVAPGGVRSVATWGGATSTTLTGETQRETDMITMPLAKGDMVRVYTYYGARSDGLAHPGAPGCWYDAEILPGDQVETGVARTTTSLQYDGYNGYRPVMPHAILGLTTSDQVSVLLLGDSITESGSAGNILDPAKSSAVRGTYAHRALETLGIPHANAAIWGSTYAQSATGVWATIPNLSAFTHVISGWGFNDLDQNALLGQPVTTVMQNAFNSWTWLAAAGPKVYQPTITPKTTSGDAWATLLGQSLVASADRRTAFNEWTRDGAPAIAGVVAPGTTDPAAIRLDHPDHPLSGYLEIADTIMSARNSEKFRVDQGPMTVDGGHPNVAGHELMKAPVIPWGGALAA